MHIFTYCRLYNSNEKPEQTNVRDVRMRSQLRSFESKNKTKKAKRIKTNYENKHSKLQWKNEEEKGRKFSTSSIQVLQCFTFAWQSWKFFSSTYMYSYDICSTFKNDSDKIVTFNVTKIRNYHTVIVFVNKAFLSRSWHHELKYFCVKSTPYKITS